MNKTQLVKECEKIFDLEIYERYKATRKINNFFDSIFYIVENKGKLKIKNFGTFKIKRLQPRRVVISDKEYYIKAKNKISFTPSINFKKEIAL